MCKFNCLQILGNQCPHYLNNVFIKASLRNSYQKLQQLFCKTSTDQNAVSFIGLALWNKVPEEIKRATNVNLNIILRSTTYKILVSQCFKKNSRY